LLLDHAFRRLDRRGEAVELELGVDERLEQLERHLLRQAALMQLELGTDDDDRAAGIIDALAEQVLPEAALLALEHVGERLQRPPSSGTSGRSSGGMTGTTSRIIHSGRLFESMKASSSFSRLTSFLRLASELVSRSSWRTFSRSSSRLMAESIFCSASAPIAA